MLLTARNLHKRFGSVHALRGVSFQVAAGEIYSLLGPNGAGKTTTINILTTLLTADDGEAFIGGYSVAGQARQVREIVGVVPQEIALYGDLTASENLHFWGRMYGLRGRLLKERVAEALALAGLQARAHDRVHTFSGGMKRRLNIAVGLLHRPRLLFLDEPTVGIDPQSRRRILDTIKQLNQQGLTVLYTTHYMEEAQELSDRIGIMDQGLLIAEGTLDDLIRIVGAQERILLQLVSPPPAPDTLQNDLAASAGVVGVQCEGAEVHLQVDEANRRLPGLLAWMQANGLQVRRIEIQEPDLEAVFLQLTGRALRD